MDLQSVEILKGPQPVFFGQNVIAGAFNLTTAKPTPQWEGYVDAEIGVNNFQEVEFAVGGPLTDTLGIREAGIVDRSDGFLRDIVTNQDYPRYKNYGGRVILQWSPNDAFQATAKMEIANLRQGADGFHVCKREEGVFNVNPLTPTQSALFLDPPLGVGWDIGHRPLGECYKSNDALVPSGNLPPSTDVYFGYGITQHMILNINNMDRSIPLPSTADGFRWGNRDPYIFEPRESLKPWNLYLNLTYQLDNGIEISSLTAYDYYYRLWMRNVQAAAFYTDLQNRETDQYSISQELRVSSPIGGALEWMIGAFYQNIDLDFYSDSLRATNDVPRRYNEAYEDAEWKSVFGTLTYNFLDGKASLDLGARYSNTTKETLITGYGAEWIQSDGTVIPWRTLVFPGGSNAHRLTYAGDSVIGMTPLRRMSTGINGPHLGTSDINELNPQISLRYRPNVNMSLYAKYAESFKASGYNTGLATIPTVDGWQFGPEYGANYEAGIKGTLLDGQARYDVSLFYAKITDLQLASATPSQENNLLNYQNAGAQRNQGVEFTFDWSATDRLRLTLNGAIMDGVMLDYRGAGCTNYEFQFASETGCDPVTRTIDRSGQQAPNTPDWKFVLTADYRWPLWNGYEGFMNAKGYVSDGYITDTTSFDLINKFNRHGDLNMSAGFGPQDGSWVLSGYVRNILEAHESFNSEFSVIPPAPFQQYILNRSNFMTYGLKFRYNYN